MTQPRTGPILKGTSVYSDHYKVQLNEVHVSALPGSSICNSSQTYFLPQTFLSHTPFPLSNRTNHRNISFSAALETCRS